MRYLAEIDNSPDAVRKVVAKLSREYEHCIFGTRLDRRGMVLHRQLTDLGHVCGIGAPTMIPKRCGDWVKTNRRDSVALVKLLRRWGTARDLGAGYRARGGAGSNPRSRGGDD